jgi:hypothetical protein
MLQWLHALVQHPDYLDKTRPQCSEVDQMNRTSDPCRSVARTRISQMKTSQAGAQQIAFDGGRPVRRIGGFPHCGDEKGFVPVCGGQSPTPDAYGQDMGDIGSRQSGEPISCHARSTRAAIIFDTEAPQVSLEQRVVDFVELAAVQRVDTFIDLRPQRLQFEGVLVTPLPQGTQRVADCLTRVLVLPGLDQIGNIPILFLSKVDIARRHGAHRLRKLCLANIAKLWQTQAPS